MTLVAADSGGMLTLGDAVREALVRNGAVMDAQDAVTLGEAAVRVAESTFKPTLTPSLLGALGGSTLSNQTYGVGFLQRMPFGTSVHANVSAASSRNQVGPFFAGDTSLMVTQSLLRGFGRAASLREVNAARLQASDAQLQRAAVQQQTALDVATAYFRIVLQAQVGEVADKALERARGVLEASQAKLAIGRVSKLDVLRAQQLVTAAELQVSDARASVEEAKDQLRLLMRRGADFEFSVVGDIPSPRSDLSLDEALKAADASRLDVRLAADAVRLAQMTLASAIDQELPQLDVSLSLTRQAAGTTWASAFDGKFQVATFVNVSMPLLNRTPQVVARQTAALEVERRRRALEDARMRAAQQVRIAFRQQERLAKVVEESEATATFASEESELAALRFQRGLSNNLDLVNAEANLLGARARRLAAVADLALAGLRLRATVGVLDPDADFRR